MRKLNPVNVYLIMSASHAMFTTLIFTVNIVYQATTIGLNPMQLVLVGTTLEITAFIFQVPTGVFADVFSRRLSIILGTFLIGLGFTLEGSVPRFEAVLVAQIIWGIGISFIDGAQQAWLSDEVGVEKAGPLFLRAAQIGSICGLLMIIPSVILGSIALFLPVLLGGLLFLALGVFLLVFMPEGGFKKSHTEERTSWQQMAGTLRGGIGLVRRKPVLLTVLGVGAIYGLYSEGFDRLWRDHLQMNFTFPTIGNWQPVVWFGIISAILTVLSIGANEIARRRLDINSHVAVSYALFGLNAVMVLGFLLFGVAGNFVVAVVAYWAISLARNTTGPLYTAWVNQHTESGVRATVFSFAGQIDALGQIIGGPIFGAIAMLLSLRAEMIAVGLFLAPSLLLLIRGARRNAPSLAALDLAEPIASAD